ncbi:hypothetical protein [Chlamydiifrater phoenicopteri]|uniref:hypothetical protein n=1 Tax=Chlamydiifrater phoenicopteri TaxID=2681469 RepID=UPI001BD0D17E|nr:hypothetical protein [Chlamydiifrater phoenicopteri]
MSIHFNPYGQILSFGASQGNSSNGEGKDSVRKIVGEIASTAIKHALIASVENISDRKSRKHRFRLISKKKQAKIILSALKNIHLDSAIFKSMDNYEKKKRDPGNRCVVWDVRSRKCKFPIRIGKKAAEAISEAAEYWVIARNNGLLEMADTLFFQKYEG